MVTYNDGSTPSVTYSYDRMGRMSSVDRDSITTTFAHDLANDVLSESYSGGILDGLSVTNGYDTSLRRTGLGALAGSSLLTGATYGYDNASRLATVSSGSDSATYSYVANSPLVGQIAFKHSGATKMTTTKQYDFLNRLTSISSPGTPASFSYKYNNANQRTMATVPDSHWSYQYDSLGQVTSGKKYWTDGTSVAGQQFEYSFDDIGNRNTTKSGGDQTGSNLRLANYTNNVLNQITSRDVPGYKDVVGLSLVTNAVTVNGLSTYRKGEYFRNELIITNTTAPAWTNVSIAAGTNGVSGNLLVPKTPETFSYDADGNLTGDGLWTYTWDAENRLVSMQSISTVVTAAKKKLDFNYDHQGRRIQKLVSTNSGTSYVGQYTNRFVYDGWNLIAELAPNSSPIRTYLWGTDLSGGMQGAGGIGGLLEISYSGASTTNCFIAFDGNGNISALVDAVNGHISATYENGPFGEALRGSGTMAKANPLRFSTKYEDDETDLLYYGHRYNNANTGRWLSRDPSSEDDPCPNVYAFVANDAIDNSDVLGLVTVQFVEAWTAGLKMTMEGQNIPCCCNSNRAVGAFLQSVSVVGKRATVAAHLRTSKKGDCELNIIEYWWWNCFRAHREAKHFGVLPTSPSDQRWTNYRWKRVTKLQTDWANGTVLDPYYDSNHWGWIAYVVYTHCLPGRGIMTVDYVPAPEMQYTWSVLQQTWTDFAPAF